MKTTDKFTETNRITLKEARPIMEKVEQFHQEIGGIVQERFTLADYPTDQDPEEWFKERKKKRKKSVELYNKITSGLKHHYPGEELRDEMVLPRELEEDLKVLKRNLEFLYPSEFEPEHNTKDHNKNIAIVMQILIVTAICVGIILAL